MLLDFEQFKIVLKKLNVEPETYIPSCPISTDSYCLANHLNCNRGKNDNCTQNYKFYLDGDFHYIEVIFYGNKKHTGYVNTEAGRVHMLINKHKAEFASILKNL